MAENTNSPPFIASRFHEAYESLAPLYGYETREESAVPWDEVPPQNKALMQKVVSRLIHAGVIVAGPAWDEHAAAMQRNQPTEEER